MGKFNQEAVLARLYSDKKHLEMQLELVSMAIAGLESAKKRDMEVELPNLPPPLSSPRSN